MTTFAHTETGKALDPHLDADMASYEGRYSAGIVATWTVVQVPDGTQHGAIPDGHGGWVNPPAPPNRPDAIALTARGTADRNASLMLKANACLRKGDVAGAQLYMNKMEK